MHGRAPRRRVGRDGWSDALAAAGGDDADLAWLAGVRAALEHRPDGIEKRLLPGEARVLRNLLKTAIPRAAGDAGGRGRG